LILPETSFNNRLAQRPKGKQKRFIIKAMDSGVFVSQAHNVSQNDASLEPFGFAFWLTAGR
jgi:hypothetical protein